MTEKEKARAYDEALKKARQLCDYPTTKPFISDLQDLFPELKESEDEKVRKEIQSVIEQLDKDTTICGKKYDYNQWLTWLEKQGESKSAGKMQVSEKLYEHIRNTCACIDDALSSETLADVKDYISQANYDAQSAFDMIEKQGEQKPADKVEPKFHQGEWITNGDYTWKIVEVKPLVYILQSQDGNIVDDTISHVDEQFHSFTIEYAKDGDVLYCESSGIEYIIILKQINNRSLDSYCRYNTVDGFAIDVPRVMSIQNNPKPATKEQRDTLLKAMTDAGYTFDFEKKELKKIEKESSWSEEDEYRINRISDFIWKNRKGDTDEIYQQEQDVNWLKSFIPQKQWKPSNVQMQALKEACDIYWEPDGSDALYTLYEQLKKLTE